MTNRDIDILCVGEALVDFIGHQEGVLINNTRDYHRYLGGSPTNVAMNTARLGLNTTLVASIGTDGLGAYILERLNEVEINIDHIKKIETSPTSIIFVSRSLDTPDFIPYRNADFLITETQLPSSLLKKTTIFHTTCFALSKNPAQKTIISKAKEAFQLGCKLSIDINYSEKIWQNKENALHIIKEYCSYNPLVKISEDDVARLFDDTLTHEEVFEFFHKLGVDLVCLTLGKNGVKLSQRNKELIHKPAIKINKVMDATGAGDAFWSGFLFAYLKENTIEDCLRIALNLAALKLQNVGRLPNNINILSELLKK
ncbi:carbohydrate kinase [Kordia sp. YSTF-M3]|uniref:Carbohydrate kinase n=1 Tax=Kordia aestuariivivens TaxID=2759037 RepID=A0ABR7QBQ4_9FLAO|nr:PfkB family carbohydrate kinase [Kordia aestuariivivens]MBC8755943.1 carbohydrate kinase [Kordia aestuariivivens]